MSAAELREAAALMRQRAAAADKFAQAEGWWQPTPLRQAFSAFVGEGETLQGADEDAEHIASWHPAVALAVADWLDRLAGAYDFTYLTPDSVPTMREALAVARAYLGGAP